MALHAMVDEPTVSERLFAGGTTGFLFLVSDDRAEARLAVWAAVAEKLGFSGLLCQVREDDHGADARAAAARLSHLGVGRFCVVAAQGAAWASTCLAGEPASRAMVLVAPSPTAPTRAEWRAARLPRLLIVDADDGAQQRAARALRRAAAGPIVVRHVHGDEEEDALGGVFGVRAGEAALKFCLPFLGGVPAPTSFEERGRGADV